MIFSSDKTFDLISYRGERGYLLLRSRISRPGEVSTEVSFQDVRHIELGVWLEGLEVSLAESASEQPHLDRYSGFLEPGLQLYLLSGRSWSGALLAASVNVREVQCDRRWEDAVDEFWRSERLAGASP
jgi:hypothetical protein